MKLNASAITNVGKARGNNEDNFFFNGRYKNDVNIKNDSVSANFSDETTLFAVCDGMGGEADGEIASLVAVQNLVKYGCEQWPQSITVNINNINTAVDNERKNRGKSSMGTTFAGVYFDGNKAVACNVGDSRVYLHRDGKLTQITEDHSQLQSLINMGMSKEQVMSRKHGGNALTQYLGMDDEDIQIEPYFSGVIELRKGDRFLICSDGVTDMIPDESIEKILSATASSDVIVRTIENTALNAGGKDNITAIVVDVTEAEMAINPKYYIAIAAMTALIFLIVFLVVFSMKTGNKVEKEPDDGEHVTIEDIVHEEDIVPEKGSVSDEEGVSGNSIDGLNDQQKKATSSSSTDQSPHEVETINY